MSSCPSIHLVPPTILVVDDQEPNVQLVCGFLLDEGYEVVPASNGPQALERIASQLPDLILMDLLMPGMDGFALCQRVRLIPECAAIPVIFLSAADESEFIVRALESGGVDYITKPFRKAELIARVRTHLALKTSRDKLAQLLCEKDELMAVLAHDLKNPLTAIGLSVQTLQSKTDPDPSFLAKVTGTIESTVNQMRTTIETLLSEKASERAEFPLTYQPINLQAAIKDAAGALRSAAAAKQIKLEVEGPNASIIVQADAQALRHILDNLFSNAIKFSPYGSTVIITAQQNAEEMPAVTVADQGPGLTEADMAGLFQKYSRLSARPTAGESSTGLGLAIVKMLTERMSGTVKGENRPDGPGALFTLCLPPA